MDHSVNTIFPSSLLEHFIPRGPLFHHLPLIAVLSTPLSLSHTHHRIILIAYCAPVIQCKIFRNFSALNLEQFWNAWCSLNGLDLALLLCLWEIDEKEERKNPQSNYIASDDLSGFCSVFSKAVYIAPLWTTLLLQNIAIQDQTPPWFSQALARSPFFFYCCVSTTSILTLTCVSLQSASFMFTYWVYTQQLSSDCAKSQCNVSRLRVNTLTFGALFQTRSCSVNISTFHKSLRCSGWAAPLPAISLGGFLIGYD